MRTQHEKAGRPNTQDISELAEVHELLWAAERGKGPSWEPPAPARQSEPAESIDWSALEKVALTPTPLQWLTARFPRLTSSLAYGLIVALPPLAVSVCLRTAMSWRDQGWDFRLAHLAMSFTILVSTIAVWTASKRALALRARLERWYADGSESLRGLLPLLLPVGTAVTFWAALEGFAPLGLGRRPLLGIAAGLLVATLWIGKEWLRDLEVSPWERAPALAALVVLFAGTWNLLVADPSFEPIPTPPDRMAFIGSSPLGADASTVAEDDRITFQILGLLALPRGQLNPARFDRALYARLLEGMATVLLQENELDQAEELYKASLRILEDELGEHHPALKGSLEGQAEILVRRGEQDQARAIHERIASLGAS